MKMRWTANSVRDTFVNYFARHKNLPHEVVASSPLVPLKDPTLAFVNAGMNQFKDIILSRETPRSLRVTNSQKCLRINDLSLVGRDTYHHTFFEMLGSWSFGDYFKKDACLMALELLTHSFKLDPDRLYFTYFSGKDDVPPDLETKAIWESLGISKRRILPFQSDNFWTMGPVGPCGPSTEIHYDHRGTDFEPSLVNKDSGHLVEIWNLVFMQYNRLPTGILERLQMSHVVDTGAGLERLTAVMNNFRSNYDTDLFQPIFRQIGDKLDRPYTGCFELDCIDTQYRIFADHMRAIVMVLSDDVLPQEKYKIRKLLHRCFHIMEDSFGFFLPDTKACHDFLYKVVKEIIVMMMKPYPRLIHQSDEIMAILDKELNRVCAVKNERMLHPNRIFPSALVSEYPGLSQIPKSDIDRILALGLVDGPTAYKWYDTYGVTSEAIEEMCSIIGLEFNPDLMQAEIDEVKKQNVYRSANHVLSNAKDLKNTLEENIHSHMICLTPLENGGYFNPDDPFICSPPIIKTLTLTDLNGTKIDKLSKENAEPGEEYYLILNRTPFQPATEEMHADRGHLVLENGTRLDVTDVITVPSGWILHKVKVQPGSYVNVYYCMLVTEAEVDRNFRAMQKETLHCLNELKSILKDELVVVRYKYQYIKGQDCKIRFVSLRDSFDVAYISHLADRCFERKIPIVMVSFKPVKVKGGGGYEIDCVAGKSVPLIIENGNALLTKAYEVKRLRDDLNAADRKTKLKRLLKEIEVILANQKRELPDWAVKESKEVLITTVKQLEKEFEKEELMVMKKSVADCPDATVVKFFECEKELKSLQKLTQAVKDRPVMVLICSENGILQGRCVLPQSASEIEEVSAEEWMNQVRQELNIEQIKSKTSQNPKFVANLKRTDISSLKHKIPEILEKTKSFMDQFQLPKKSMDDTNSTKESAHS